MPATKVDYRRELKSLYSVGRAPVLVEVPELSFLKIDGRGDPNTAPAFAEAVAALYAIAYTAKFAVKRGRDGADYGVMPLEGLFWAPDPAAFTNGDRSSWEWTLMIMQPDLVTADIFVDARATAAEKKKPSDAIGRVRLEPFAEGLAAQVLHIGPWAAETETIAALHAFIVSEGLERAGKHHEIYLSDPRRVPPEKLKTIIRQPVAA